MVSILHAAFDSNHIFLTKRSKMIDAVINELENFEMRISDDGRITLVRLRPAHTMISFVHWASRLGVEQSGELIKV